MKSVQKKGKILIFFLLILVWKGGLAEDRYSRLFRLDGKCRGAEANQPDERAVSPYSLDLTRELVIFGVSGAMAGAGLIIIHNLDPLTDEEIDALDPMDVNKFDRDAIGVPRETLAGDGLVFASLLLPLTFLTYGETKKDFGMLAVMGAEVLLMNQGINLVAKGLTKRTRPYVYDPETPYDYKIKTKARLSFYSGHTSNAACMTFFVAKVFSDYLTNKTAKTIIWGTAALYPFVVGLARNDTANHFPTDTITGYLVGAVIGVGIPLLHKTKNKNLSIHPLIYGGDVQLAFRYSF